MHECTQNLNSITNKVKEIIDKNNLKTDPKIIAITKTFDKFNIHVNQIGRTGGEKIRINNVIDLLVADAKQNWETGLRNKL